MFVEDDVFCLIYFFFFNLLLFVLVNRTANRFGVTEFVNPKDHEKPVQEVRSQNLCFLLNDQIWFYYFANFFPHLFR